MKTRLLLGIAAAFILIQFFPAPPAKTNPVTDPARTFPAVMKPSPEVDGILRRACYDCHSNETVWPWYSDVAPVSWVIRNHVLDGRKHLNFSEWLKPGETSFTQWSDVEDMCKSVRERTMPIAGYDWTHGGAKLSGTDRQTVCRWTEAALAAAR